MRNSILCLFLFSAELISAFIPPSPTRINRRAPLVTDSQPHLLENERLIVLTAHKKTFPSESRRRWMQKLSGSAAAIAASLVNKKRPAFAGTSKDTTTTSLPPSSAVLDPTVLTLTKGSKTIHIVGTAHISSVSADLAEQLVRETAPEAVFVELDAARMSRAFKGGIPPKGVSVAIQDDKGTLRVGVTQQLGLAKKLFIKFINNLSNPAMYKQLEMAGIPVGQEFVKAVKAGIDNNSLIILGDQRLDVTYKRLGKAMKQANKKKLDMANAKLTNIMKQQLPDIEKWEQEGKRLRASQVRQYVESMKTVQITARMMDVFKKEVPGVWKAMVGERDAFMARNLNALPSELQTVVAVMGLGHLKGVQQSLQAKGWKVLSLE